MCNVVCLLVMSVYAHLDLAEVSETYSCGDKREMEKYWQKLSLLYITEESDDPDNPNGIIEHKLHWCSQSKFINEISVITHNNSDLTVFVELSDFMAVLNNRLAKNRRQLAFGMVAKKVRKEGAPSQYHLLMLNPRQ